MIPERNNPIDQPELTPLEKIKLFGAVFSAMSVVSQERKNPIDQPELTPLEEMWLDFKSGETPHSLEWTDDDSTFLGGAKVVLDDGSGSGRIADIIAEKTKAISVIGVDINSSVITWGQALPHYSIVSLAVMNGRLLDFPDHNFDAVVMFGLLGGVELETRECLLRQAYRVTERGGKIIVAEFKMNDNDHKQREKYERHAAKTGEYGSRIVYEDGNEDGKILFVGRHFKESELSGLVSAAGFEIMDVRKQTIESRGIGDGKKKKRQQITVWGQKPWEKQPKQP